MQLFKYHLNDIFLTVMLNGKSIPKCFVQNILKQHDQLFPLIHFASWIGFRSHKHITMVYLSSSKCKRVNLL